MKMVLHHMITLCFHMKMIRYHMISYRFHMKMVRFEIFLSHFWIEIIWPVTVQVPAEGDAGTYVYTRLISPRYG